MSEKGAMDLAGGIEAVMKRVASLVFGVQLGRRFLKHFDSTVGGTRSLHSTTPGPGAAASLDSGGNIPEAISQGRGTGSAAIGYRTSDRAKPRYRRDVQVGGSWFGYISRKTFYFGEERQCAVDVSRGEFRGRCADHRSRDAKRKFGNVKTSGPRTAYWTLLYTEEPVEGVIAGTVAMRPASISWPAGFSSCADPFAYNRTIFCEMIRKNAKNGKDGHGQGVIGTGLLHKNGSLQLQIAIEEPWHLSYPFVFVENQELLVVPESNKNRQHLFGGKPISGNPAGGSIYNCTATPCARMDRRLLPNLGNTAIADANLIHFHDPKGRSVVMFSYTDKKGCRRHTGSWATRPNAEAQRLTTAMLEPVCFPGLKVRGRGAGSLRDFFPTQFNPQFYGQYIDLWDLHTLDYVKTLRVDPSSGFRGTHHIAQDPVSSLVVMDSQ